MKIRNVVIVSLVVVIGRVQVAIATAEDEGRETQIPPSVSIATLDVAKVFQKSHKFNAAMAPIKAKMDPAPGEHIKKYDVLPPDKKEALAAETKLYAETYQRLNEIVTRFCKARNIGLVIRVTLDSTDMSDKSSVLKMVIRPVVYSDVPDLTDEVIAELDR